MKVKNLLDSIEIYWEPVYIGDRPIVDIVDNIIYLGNEEDALFDGEIINLLEDLDEEEVLIVL